MRIKEKSFVGGLRARRLVGMLAIGLMALSGAVLAADLESLMARAEGGDPAAQVELGLLYESGDSVGQDDAMAFHWIERAAKSGNAEGQFYLGWLYANGYGVARDNLQAYLWFDRAARQGHEGADDQKEMLLPDLTQDQLAEIRARLGEGEGAGETMRRQQDEAVAKVAEEIGWDFKDLRRAYNQRRYEVVPLLRQLASNGDPEAQNLVGYHLRRLGRANPEDATVPREAFRWFLESARQGYPAAQYNLAVCYMEGFGTDRSAASAVRWFTLARDNMAIDGTPSYQDVTAEFREASEYSDRYGAAMQGYRSAARELSELIGVGLQESKARRSIE